MTTSEELTTNEWLQFMEFIKRKYGNNSSEYIRINDYNNVDRSGKSVAAYYANKYQNASISSNYKLSDLLKNQNFIELFKLDNPVAVSKFTEIYNDTNYLMNSLNTKKDNLYIKCNPVNEKGDVIEEPSASAAGANLNNVNSVLTEGSTFFTTEALFNNVGVQLLLSILILAIIYFIGHFITFIAPEKIQAAKNYAYTNM